VAGQRRKWETHTGSGWRRATIALDGAGAVARLEDQVAVAVECAAVGIDPAALASVVRQLGCP
jgi:hypothetical protein